MEGFWARFSLDPRQSHNERMRASDADREIVRSLLADAFADGRLTRAEHDERVGTLLEARTLGELPGLVDDLIAVDLETSPVVPGPAEVATFRERGLAVYRKEVQEAVATLLMVNIVTWGIWGFTSGPDGHLWPIYPMLFLILNLIGTAVRREAIVDREVQRLEKKAAKKAAKRAAKEAESSAPGELPTSAEPADPILDSPTEREHPSEGPPDKS